jgi:hypothetical protein
MAFGQISGPLLNANLLRNGVDLAFNTDLLYLDVVNKRIGINTTTPSSSLSVNGTIQTTTLNVANSATLSNFTLTDNTIGSSNNTITLDANVIAYKGAVIIDSNLNISSNSITSNTALSITALAINVNSNLTVNGTLSANTLSINNTTIGNFTISNNTIANNNIIEFVNGTNGYTKFSGTNGIVIPFGDSTTRPNITETGMIRFNTTDQCLEIYNGASWYNAAGTAVNYQTASEIGILSAIALA